MSAEGTLGEIAGPPPACDKLPVLPASLFEHRVGSEVEGAFLDELRKLDERIMADAPAAKRSEHASKTYHMLACVAAVARAAPAEPFFALGQFRSAEKARTCRQGRITWPVALSRPAGLRRADVWPHPRVPQARALQHSSIATGLYDLGYLLPVHLREGASVPRRPTRIPQQVSSSGPWRSQVAGSVPRPGGTVLALALGGSSDIIGVLAWARACGFERIVLVQPGSPPRGTPSPTLELQRVQPAQAGAPA